jgi:hypothetical protein
LVCNRRRRRVPSRAPPSPRLRCHSQLPAPPCSRPYAHRESAREVTRLRHDAKRERCFGGRAGASDGVLCFSSVCLSTFVCDGCWYIQPGFSIIRSGIQQQG